MGKITKKVAPPTPCKNMAELSKLAKVFISEVKGGITTSNFNSAYLRFKRVAGTLKNKGLHNEIKASEYNGYRAFFASTAKAESAFTAYKKVRTARVSAHRKAVAKKAVVKVLPKVALKSITA